MKNPTAFSLGVKNVVSMSPSEELFITASRTLNAQSKNLQNFHLRNRLLMTLSKPKQNNCYLYPQILEYIFMINNQKIQLFAQCLKQILQA